MSSFEREERKKAEIWTTQRRRGSEYEALLYYYRQCYIDGVILSKISRLEFFTRRSTSFQLYSSLVKKTKIYLSRSRCIRILSVKNILPSRGKKELFLEYSWILCIDYSRGSISRDADALLSNHFPSRSSSRGSFDCFLCVCLCVACTRICNLQTHRRQPSRLDKFS